MLSHIITKMVLDRTCPVCGGLKRYKSNGTTKPDMIECKNCIGTGFMADTEPSILLVESLAAVPPGVVMSMETQQMYVVDTPNDDKAKIINRLYSYDVDPDSLLFMHYAKRKPKEIHMYFGQ